MLIADIKELVLDKIKKRPDFAHVNPNYLDDKVNDAIADVIDYINHIEGAELEQALVTPIADICVIRLNLTGTEGLSSSSKASTSESYADDIPKSIQRKLKKYRRLL